jgi:hypothetical protein
LKSIDQFLKKIGIYNLTSKHTYVKTQQQQKKLADACTKFGCNIVISIEIFYTSITYTLFDKEWHFSCNCEMPCMNLYEFWYIYKVSPLKVIKALFLSPQDCAYCLGPVCHSLTLSSAKNCNCGFNFWMVRARALIFRKATQPFLFLNWF